jgi:hypothetical protein
MSYDDLFCHDPACDLFNEPQRFRWHPATQWSPTEWVDDPECRGCLGNVEEYPLDVYEELVDCIDWVPSEPEEWTPEERALVEALFKYRARKWAERHAELARPPSERKAA